MEQDVERLGDTRRRHRVALDDGLIGLGTSHNVIRLDGKNLLQHMGCAKGLDGPDLHLSEALTAKLSFTSERLLSYKLVRTG